MNTRTTHLFFVAPALALGLLWSPSRGQTVAGRVFLPTERLEWRTPISSLPFTIDEGGSYFLTRSLDGVPGMNGITIMANDVTLDLNGFCLNGVPGSLDGIAVSGTWSNLAVRNGSVRDWGGSGVSGTSRNARFDDLRLLDNGASGLVTGANAVVTHCSSMGNAQDGIVMGDGSAVAHTVVRGNTGKGVRWHDGLVNHCNASSNLAGNWLGTGSSSGNNNNGAP